MPKLILRWIEKPYQMTVLPNREDVGPIEFEHATRRAAENLVNSSGLFQRNADLTSVRFEIEED